MKLEQLEDIKSTITWLLENGSFIDLETSYNSATNSVNTLDEAINYIRCCETLKDKNDEISDLAKAFINEVDKKHPFVKLPEEEDFYMARHKLAEKLT